MMNIILLSGGSGKRLWPLSNETRSKQFLRLLKNDEQENESMVQRVYRQIRSAGINAHIVVATGKSQVDSIQSQLGHNVDIVQEPERRDTFPAIALASSYLALEKQMSPDEVVVVLPVDPFAELHYFQTLQKMESVVQANLANMALMGIRPTYPSAKYGYIVPDGIGHIGAVEYRRVDRFQEKPTEELAAQLIEQGALWNGGVFAFKLGYLMDIVRQYLEFETYADVYRQYGQLTKISFDYAVVEKESSIAMVEYDGIWKDLGTWNTLTEVMDDAAVGKVIMADTCENSHVINELDIPVTVLGAKNLVIAASPDGILVSDKHQSSYLKPLVDHIQQRPMYEERRWGEYKVLDYTTYGDDSLSLTKHMFVRAGKEISYQVHAIRDEIWTFVDGTGLLVLDGHVRNVRRGDVAYITKGTKHAIKAISDLHFIEVQIGSELAESDIERFDWDW
jgi:mannose-1-phosphate guanylyltransferase